MDSDTHTHCGQSSICDFQLKKYFFLSSRLIAKREKKNDTRSNFVEIKQENDFSLIIIRRKMRQREREREKWLRFRLFTYEENVHSRRKEAGEFPLGDEREREREREKRDHFFLWFR